MFISLLILVREGISTVIPVCMFISLLILVPESIISTVIEVYTCMYVY